MSQAPGRHTKPLVVVNSFRGSDAVNAMELSDLYPKQWLVEVQLRVITSTLKFDVLRCQTPAMIRQER